MTKILVITAEKAQEFDRQDDNAKWECDAVSWQSARAAMTEIDLDDIPVIAHGPILHRIEAHGIKEG